MSIQSHDIYHQYHIVTLEGKNCKTFTVEKHWVKLPHNMYSNLWFVEDRPIVHRDLQSIAALKPCSGLIVPYWSLYLSSKVYNY